MGKQHHHIISPRPQKRNNNEPNRHGQVTQHQRLRSQMQPQERSSRGNVQLTEVAERKGGGTPQRREAKRGNAHFGVCACIGEALDDPGHALGPRVRLVDDILAHLKHGVAKELILHGCTELDGLNLPMDNRWRGERHGRALARAQGVWQAGPLMGHGAPGTGHRTTAKVAPGSTRKLGVRGLQG